jgi:Tol biopolymer transport system component
MRKPIFVVLLVLFILLIGGYFFYQRYLADGSNFIGSVSAKRNWIYYLSSNNLYRFSPDIDQAPQKLSAAQYPSESKIIDISVDKLNNFLLLSKLNRENKSEIWRLYLDNLNLEKAFSAQTSGLENYSDFRLPKISPDNSRVAFIASHNNSDDIFVMNLKNGGLDNLLKSTDNRKINEISWTADSQKIAILLNTDTLSSIKLLGLDKNLTNLYEEAAPVFNIYALQDRLFFIDSKSLEGKLHTDINLVNFSDSKKTSIIDIYTPQKIVNFNISPDEQFIVYELNNLTTKQSNLYQIRTDGINLLQLTDNGVSSNAIFSPVGNYMAFYYANMGVYQISMSDYQKKNIFKTSEIIDKLIIWR